MMPSGANQKRHSEKDFLLYSKIEENFNSANLSVLDKLEAFPRFISKRSMARFLCKYEIYRKIVDIPGNIVECGVFNGAGLFTWAQLVNIFEPSNYTRKIVGFDTFQGFPCVNEKDNNEITKPNKGDLSGSTKGEICFGIEKMNLERHLSHISNMELIEGDFFQTGEQYLSNNRHTLISLLYLDFDLYEPTKKALEIFLPLMPKGAIICFDELNCATYPGETAAFLEMLNVNQCNLRRFSIDPWISYVTL